MQYNNLPGFMKYYQCIKDHYPIGLWPQSYWYFATEESKRLYQKITNRETSTAFLYLSDLANEIRSWEDFTELEVLSDNASPGIGIKASLKPSKFFGSVSEIYIFISLLGPYYCYLGKETGNEKWGYQDRSVIVFSPFHHYENAFQKLESLLNSKMPDFSYIPHRLQIHQINGLYHPYVLSVSDEDELKSMCLFQALFNYADIRDYLDIGDLSYRRESWAAYRMENVTLRNKFQHLLQDKKDFDL
jgi:hypothetical protein